MRDFEYKQDFFKTSKLLMNFVTLEDIEDYLNSRYICQKNSILR